MIWPDDKEGMRVVQALGRACAKPWGRKSLA